MCDTMVAVNSATSDNSVIFAKNSDREPTEAHHLLRIPRQQYPPNSMVKCTYIEIPQVEETYTVLLAKPYWMWGAEMGSNEFGVTIGNEAIFSRVPAQKKPALLGMDLLRLALERSKTARQALEIIVNLLETHGQGGNCGHLHKLYYHNTFIIADPQEAWVLETVDRLWAAEKVKTIRSISNALSIGNQWDMASDDLVTYAIAKKWCKGRDDFHFAHCFSDKLYTYFGQGRQRQACSTNLLQTAQKQITPATMMAILRSHQPQADADPTWHPDGLLGTTLCNHSSWGPVKAAAQTTGSMVSHLTPTLNTHWLTGTSAPCTSIFKPFFIQTDLPDTGPAPTQQTNPNTLWWQHEHLHRAVLKDYAHRLNTYKTERNVLETHFINQVDHHLQSTNTIPNTVLHSLSHQSFIEATQATQQWLTQIENLPIKNRPSLFYRWYWQKLNEKAKM